MRRKMISNNNIEILDCYTIGGISKKFHLDDSTVYAHKASIDKLYYVKHIVMRSESTCQ